MTDDALKCWLINKFPDLIKPDGCIVHTKVCGVHTVHSWRDTNMPITEREWDWIVRQVVGTLKPMDFRRFVTLVNMANRAQPRNAQFTTWQTRAKALVELEKMTAP